MSRPSEIRLTDHEHLLMELAGDLLGHPVAKTDILKRGDVRGLLIERFDREIEDRRVRRIHQEDFCQALGLAPRLKYERKGSEAHRFDADGIGWILSQCDAPGASRQAFLMCTIFDLLVGNTDNHGKKMSL